LHIEIHHAPPDDCETRRRVPVSASTREQWITGKGGLQMSTTEYQIEREIVIDAPVEVVWRTITEPDQISQWFADKVDLEEIGRAHV
jgi:hypothetical protein